jgi:hypothetical protein
VLPLKRITLIIGLLSVSTAAVAQPPSGRGAPPPPPLAPGASQADVDKALLAAPPGLKDQATVVAWKSDFTYDTLRKGTNRLVCFDLSGFPLEQPFSVECTSIANLDRKAQNLKAEATGDRKKSEAMLDALEKNGTRVKPEYGSVWHELGGPDQQRARGHMMIAVPGATTQSTGLPDNPKQGGAWIMNAGTLKAHIMIP